MEVGGVCTSRGRHVLTCGGGRGGGWVRGGGGEGEGCGGGESDRDGRVCLSSEGEICEGAGSERGRSSAIDLNSR